MDFLIKVGEVFELADIDLDALEKHVSLEYVKFLEYENTKEKPRSEKQIYFDTYNGLAAEHYMIEKHGYSNDDRKFKDLFSPCNTEVEIKTAASEATLQKQLDSLKQRKGWGYDVANYVICFLRVNKTYTCHSLWKFDGNDYIEVKEEPEEDRTEVIRKLERMPLEKARQTALDLLESWNPKKINGKASKNRVIYDITKSFTSSEICSIMYRLQLAQEGLGTVNSAWQSHYRSI